MIEEQFITEERAEAPPQNEPTITGHRREHRGGRGIVGAVILIAVGIIFLLSNLGIVHPNWLAILRYWPALLMLVGLDLLIGRSALGRIAVAAVGLGAILWIILWSGPPSAVPAFSLAGQAVTHSFEQGLQNVERLDVVVNLGAVEANITPLDDTQNAVSGTFRTSRELAIDTPYTVSNGTGHLTIQQQNDRFPTTGLAGELDMGLTTAVPIDLTVKMGAGEVTLDLTGINLRSLNVDGGAGELTIVLPAEGTYSVDISTGVGAVNLTVPQEMATQVSFSGGLTSINVPDRYESTGEHQWQTIDYAGASSSRADVTISAGIGEVNVVE